MSEIPSGWPCASLPSSPPSVVDVEAQPTADSLLPQILALTPRGAAWGTDEVGDGRGASPVQRSVWRALAAWAAGHLGLDWTAATQTFPSAITYTLPDWEREYGLPDLCSTAPQGTQARVAAVRAKFQSFGGVSPAYFVCLAASFGYQIAIEEPTQFFCDDSECVEPLLVDTFFTCDDSECDADPIEGWAAGAPITDGDEVSDLTMWEHWIVHVGGLGETFFLCDEGECDLDPLEGFLTAQDLECLLRRDCPPHTELTFQYDLPSA
ncbi:putative phage tail protein [Methylobacterium fujisawaense]|uniref:putative phage tail protein n=1 Tax=Methylobacterium fujisawaense TaxID=107400 RepID=UPI00313AA1EE